MGNSFQCPAAVPAVFNTTLGGNITNAFINGTSLADDDNSTDSASDDDGNGHRFSCNDVKVYMYPVQLTICIIGNILNVLVLTRERITHRRWTATQVFITSLSITDMLFLGAQFVPFMENFHLDVDYDSKDGRNVFENITWYTGGVWNWATQAFSMASDLTLVAFCLERCIATLRPMSRRFAGGRATVARNAIIIILLFSTLHSVYYLVLIYRIIILVDNYRIPRVDAIRSECLPQWLAVWMAEFEIVQLITIPIVVFLTLAITTSLVLITLAKNRRVRRQSGETSSSSSDTLRRHRSSWLLQIKFWKTKKQQVETAQPAVVLRQHAGPRLIADELSSQQYTLIMIASVVMYLVACGLNFCLNVGDVFDRYLHVPNVLATSSVTDVLRPCDSLIINWNYALNFILYSAVSSKFRINMRDLARHGLRRFNPNATTLSNNFNILTPRSSASTEISTLSDDPQCSSPLLLTSTGSPLLLPDPLMIMTETRRSRLNGTLSLAESLASSTRVRGSVKSSSVSLSSVCCDVQHHHDWTSFATQESFLGDFVANADSKKPGVARRQSA